jgi:hypothetical protein
MPGIGKSCLIAAPSDGSGPLVLHTVKRTLCGLKEFGASARTRDIRGAAALTGSSLSKPADRGGLANSRPVQPGAIASTFQDPQFALCSQPVLLGDTLKVRACSFAAWKAPTGITGWGSDI